MNNDFQDQDKNGVPVAGQILSANPVSEPSDFFPPTPPMPVKNHSTAKIAGAVFGLMFLVGGLAAGVTLIMQPQLLNQKAQTLVYSQCDITSLNSCSKKGTFQSFCTDGKLCHSTITKYYCPATMSTCSYSGFTKKCTTSGCVFEQFQYVPCSEISTGNLCQSDVICKKDSDCKKLNIYTNINYTCNTSTANGSCDTPWTEIQ